MQWQRLFDPFGLGEMGGLYGNKQQNPADKAMPYLNKMEGLYGQYGDLYKGVPSTYQNMAQNPAEYLDSLMKNYEPSQAYQQKFGQMSQAAANTAAAGGMRGSLQDIQGQADLSRSLMGEDMQQWLQNVLGIQGGGLGGLERGAENLGNVWGGQGGLAFQGQRETNKGQQDQMAAFMKMLPMIMQMM